MRKIKIPFSILPIAFLGRISGIFLGVGKKIEKNFPGLKVNIEHSEYNLNPAEYASMCITASIVFFIFINILFSIFLFLIKIENAILLSVLVSIPITLFILIQQMLYPKLVAGRKIRDIERNLLSALQNILVQLNSGVPLFNVLVSISNEDYGEVSKQFALAVKKINAGISQIEVLDQIATKNPSLYFRRAIWQLVNGMKSGADVGIVIRQIISSLSEEQLIQIQRYGGQLNPLAMFYMLITVILPSLGITFLIVISSFISSSEFITKLIFWGMYVFVLFFQIMFIGIIKTRRPTLLE
ncbi:type II secretion system F family protein [Candidatus Woesearchaeota archaeon]|nr:type II secretion system F family protein [Candidatus Woesearchaeota archaeon]